MDKTSGQGGQRAAGTERLLSDCGIGACQLPVPVMVGSHVTPQTCSHFKIYLTQVVTFPRGESEREATGWEIDGETETEWLWHWSLSHWAAPVPVDQQWWTSVSLGTASGPWWPAVEQRGGGCGGGCQEENWSEEAFTPSTAPLCSCQCPPQSVRLETLQLAKR